MTPRKILLAGLAVLTIMLWSCQGLRVQETSAPINWRTLAQGKAEAKERQLPCLVDFYYGPDCPRCQALDVQIYNNRQIVARIIRDFVPVRVRLDQALSAEEQDLQDYMGSSGECILLFLDAGGEVVKDSTGVKICAMQMITPQQFVAYMDQALTHLAAQTR